MTGTVKHAAACRNVPASPQTTRGAVTFAGVAVSAASVVVPAVFGSFAGALIWGGVWLLLTGIWHVIVGRSWASRWLVEESERGRRGGVTVLVAATGMFWWAPAAGAWDVPEPVTWTDPPVTAPAAGDN